MRPVLLLVDLQHDFLRAPTLEPAAGAIVERATSFLNGCRSSSIPVVHVWTTILPDDQQGMTGCGLSGEVHGFEGTEGHSRHAVLQPAGVDHVIFRADSSGFSSGALDQILGTLVVDTLLIAGVHLHGSLRATILDAEQRQLHVWVADDAVASDDPLHAAVSRRYLQGKGISFARVDDLLTMLDRGQHSSRRQSHRQSTLPSAVIGGKTAGHTGLETLTMRSPRKPDQVLWSLPICGQESIAEASLAARRAWSGWTQTEPSVRANLLVRWADRLDAESPRLAEQVAEETGKPLRYSLGEVARTAAVLRSVARRASQEPRLDAGKGGTVRHRSVGVIALITPWNNPLFIPVGKIAPALLYGNTVVWKPAPAGSGVAIRALEQLAALGCPPGVVNVTCGDRSTAESLMADPRVDAVTLTGSSLAGYSAQEICGRRRIPLQAELGGNNAAIVWSDCDLQDAARQIAEGAFGMAGQRCTANRRAVVEQRCHGEFLQLLEQAVADLVWGDPLEMETQVGPLLSAERRDRVSAVIDRSRLAAGRIIVPHERKSGYRDLLQIGTYYPPTIVCSEDPREEVIQEETFGPVLAVQSAPDWDRALALCNGVRQGLVAGLFSRSKELRRNFLAEAQAGILKLDRTTADAEVDLPFGGWKASGIGPPEHGDSDREFYTRTQAIYRA